MRINLWYLWETEGVADGFGGFLASGDDGAKVGELSNESADVGGLDDLEELVGSIVLQTSDGGGGVEEGKTLLLTEGNDFVDLESFVLQIHEVVPVAKEYLTLDAPMVVDEVGVIEIHAPTLTLGREAPQEQYLGILGQERTKWMIFHTVFATSYILCV